MATPRASLINTYSGGAPGTGTGTPISATDLNKRADIIDNQLLGGALYAIGAGVLNVPDATSLLVVAAGTTVTVGPGCACVIDPVEGPCIIVNQGTASPTQGAFTPDSAANFIHFLGQFPAVSTDPDSRRSLVGILLVSSSNVVAGAVLLAQCTTVGANITAVDNTVKVVNRWDAIVNRVAAAEASIAVVKNAIVAAWGTGGAGYVNVATIDARLTNLETGGGPAGSSTSGVSQAAFNALQAALTALTARVAALEAAAGVGGGTPATAPPAVGQTSNERLWEALLKVEADHIINVSPDYSQITDASHDIPGITGGGEIQNSGTSEVLTAGNAIRDAVKRSVHG